MLKPSRNISRTMQVALINNVKRRKSRLSGGDVTPTVTYDNIIFFGSSTTERAFNTKLTDMSLLLSDYGLTPSLYSNGLGGTKADAQASTYMPQTTAMFTGLSNALCWIQSATNSITTTYDGISQPWKDAFFADETSVCNQASAAGWTPVISNLNYASNFAAQNRDEWNTKMMLPIALGSAPASVIGGSGFIYDYWKLSNLSPQFNNSDGVHLHPVSGDRLYRSFSAMQMAKLQGKYSPKSLNGRRVIIGLGGDTDVSWVNYNGINAAPISPTMQGVTNSAITARCFDANTGELLTDLWVVIGGFTGVNLTGGRGNTGNTSTTLMNDTLLKKVAFSGDGGGGTIPLKIEIGTFGGVALPSASISIISSRSVTPDGTKKCNWTFGGETKLQDAELLPPVPISFTSKAPINSKHTIDGNFNAGSNFIYFSGIDIQFS